MARRISVLNVPVFLLKASPLGTCSKSAQVPRGFLFLSYPLFPFLMLSGYFLSAIVGQAVWALLRTGRLAQIPSSIAEILLRDLFHAVSFPSAKTENPFI